MNNINEFYKLSNELINFKKAYADITNGLALNQYNDTPIESVDVRMFDTYPIGIELGKVVFSAYATYNQNDRRNMLANCDRKYIAPYMKKAVENLSIQIVEETIRLMEEKKNSLKANVNDELSKINELMNS